MSSKKIKRPIDSGFRDRFIEVCGGSGKARDVQQVLNVTYQAAKNYLTTDRVPGFEQLLAIAENTPYSLHWLLTGVGKKFVDERPETGAPVPSRQFEESVRKIVLEVINEKAGRREATGPTIVRLHSSDVYSEKVAAETATSSDSPERADLPD
jgi:hypothetical protein